ncbi:hypothetical protein BN1088_1432765 [Sphingobacterium sp. PM2-P1-29]|nr:hypothetical protein BN1088_1432765 [Sphingobacterium sp. PM2-P1-29]
MTTFHKKCGTNFYYIDQKHKIFLLADLVELRKYRTELDNETQAATFNFYDRSEVIYQQIEKAILLNEQN